MLAILVTKLFGTKGMFYLGAFALVVILLGSGYLAAEHAVNRYAKVEAEAVTMRAQLATQAQTLDVATKNAAAWQKALGDYKSDVQHENAIQADAAAQRSKIDDAFTKHDVPALARARPDLVEGVLNRGALRAQRMLNCATGGADCPAPATSSPGR